MIFIFLCILICVYLFIIVDCKFDAPTLFLVTAVSIVFSAIISIILVTVIGIGITKTEVSYQYDLVPMSIDSKEVILTKNRKSYDISFTYCDSFGIYRSVNEDESIVNIDVHFTDDSNGYAVIYKTTKTVNPKTAFLVFPYYKPNESIITYEYEVYVNPANIIKEEEIR